MLAGRGKCFEGLARSKSTPLAESICSPMAKALYNLRVALFLASGLQGAKRIHQPLLCLYNQHVISLPLRFKPCPLYLLPFFFCFKLGFCLLAVVQSVQWALAGACQCSSLGTKIQLNTKLHLPPLLPTPAPSKATFAPLFPTKKQNPAEAQQK